MSIIDSRLDTHEAICTQRYNDLHTDIKELKESVKELLESVSMGKGAVKMLFGLGALLITVWTGIKIIKEYIT